MTQHAYCNWYQFTNFQIKNNKNLLISQNFKIRWFFDYKYLEV